MNEKFAFLTSTRFWALILGAVMFYLKAKGWVGESEMILANTILAGFITIKTIDRNIGDKPVEVANINAGIPTVSTTTGTSI